MDTNKGVQLGSVKAVTRISPASRSASAEEDQDAGLAVGATIAAVLCLVAVVLYFARRYTAVVAVAGLTVVALLVYKLVFMA